MSEHVRLLVRVVQCVFRYINVSWLARFPFTTICDARALAWIKERRSRPPVRLEEKARDRPSCPPVPFSPCQLSSLGQGARCLVS
eukprot:5147478-Pyramimonas_sp.AAC.1